MNSEPYNEAGTGPVAQPALPRPVARLRLYVESTAREYGSYPTQYDGRDDITVHEEDFCWEYPQLLCELCQEPVVDHVWMMAASTPQSVCVTHCSQRYAQIRAYRQQYVNGVRVETARCPVCEQVNVPPHHRTPLGHRCAASPWRP